MKVPTDRETGLTRIWDKHHNKGQGGWRYVWPVDAREMIAMGTASLSAPENAPPPPPPPAPIPPTGGDDVPAGKDQPVDPKLADPANHGGDDPAYDFEKHSLNDLRRFVSLAGLKGLEKANKEDLVTALASSGWRPTA